MILLLSQGILGVTKTSRSLPNAPQTKILRIPYSGKQYSVIRLEMPNGACKFMKGPYPEPVRISSDGQLLSEAFCSPATQDRFNAKCSRVSVEPSVPEQWPLP